MSVEIHPTAIIDSTAEIGENVSIGPFCWVGPGVKLEAGVGLVSNVILSSNVHLGAYTTVYPFAVLGCVPQFRQGAGGNAGRIEVGAHVTIREHVTIHLGSQKGSGVTTIGDHCFLMVGAHVAHDCVLGHHVELVNQATLGGHCTVGDWAIIGGLTAVHQNVRIGHHAIVGGMSGVENDVIPYGSVFGNRARLAGLNIVGLKRRDFSRDDIHDLRNAYRLLFADEGTFSERVDDVADMFATHTPIMEIVNFIRQDSKRSLCLPR